MAEQMFNEDALCPYTNGKKSCRAFRAKESCAKHVEYVFTDGAGEQHVQRGCCDFFALRMQMETANQMRQLGAAIESLRNTVITQQEAAVQRYTGLDKQVVTLGELMYDLAEQAALRGARPDRTAIMDKAARDARAIPKKN